MAKITKKTSSQYYVDWVPTFFICVIVGFAIFVIFYRFQWVDFHLLSSIDCEPLKEGRTICFFDNENKWNSDTYLSTITSFYSTIITILLAVLTLLSVVAFLVIRSSSIESAERRAEKIVEKYIGSSEFRDMLSNEVTKSVKEATEENLNKISVRLELVENVLLDKGILEEPLFGTDTLNKKSDV